MYYYRPVSGTNAFSSWLTNTLAFWLSKVRIELVPYFPVANISVVVF